MIYSGSAISVSLLSDGIAELKFDLTSESVNKFDRTTFAELSAATDAIRADKQVQGVIVTSGKGVFIVGADITEFDVLFAGGEAQVAAWVVNANKIFAAFEDLDMPKVAAINGFALGGGFEMTLACEYRVMSTAAKVGLPETKLGLMPGFGGTIRLPRLIGVDNAVEWIASGAERRPEAALKDGAVDAVVAPEKLKDAAIDLVRQCLAGKLDWRAKRAEKLAPLKLNSTEQMMAFNTASAMIAAQAGPNYPAPKLAIQNMQTQANATRDEAIAIEAQFFAKAAATPQANAMVGLFLAEQAVQRRGRPRGRSFRCQPNRRIRFSR